MKTLAKFITPFYPLYCNEDFQQKRITFFRILSHFTLKPKMRYLKFTENN